MQDFVYYLRHEYDMPQVTLIHSIVPIKSILSDQER